jgi:hypothetical protein
MAQLDLTPEEALILRETLEAALSELHLEIAATDNRAYRDDLKRRKAVLLHVIESLAANGANPTDPPRVGA